MKKLDFARLGGIAMIIGGVALGYSYVSHPHHMPPEVIASRSWIVIHAIFAVSIAFGLIGTTALYALTAVKVGKLGFVGYVLLFTGMIMIFGLDYYEFLIAPFLAANYPAVIIDWGPGDTMGPIKFAFPLSGLLTVIGYALLGAAWKRDDVLPGKVGIALIVTAIGFGVGLSPLGDIFIAQITAALFGVSLVAVGICAVRKKQRFTVDILT